MKFDFKLFKNSVGKNLKFEVTVRLTKNDTFTDAFYVVLREVYADYIIVEHFYLQSDKDFNEIVVSQKRKLVKEKFKLCTEIPLNL